jgi:hypothetical protein
VWLMDPKTFLKSIYNKYMSCMENFASSRAPMIDWSRLEVHRSTLNPSWLPWSMRNFSPYVARIVVSVLVKNL